MPQPMRERRSEWPLLARQEAPHGDGDSEEAEAHVYVSLAR